MEEDRVMFFHELEKIQRKAINDCLCNAEKYEMVNNILDDVTYGTLNNMLDDVTYNVLVMILELIDGYVNKRIKCKVRNIKTGNVINSDIEMQDLLPNFLKRSDVY